MLVSSNQLEVLFQRIIKEGREKHSWCALRPRPSSPYSMSFVWFYRHQDEWSLIIRDRMISVRNMETMMRSLPPCDKVNADSVRTGIPSLGGPLEVLLTWEKGIFVDNDGTEYVAWAIPQ